MYTLEGILQDSLVPYEEPISITLTTPKPPLLQKFSHRRHWTSGFKGAGFRVWGLGFTRVVGSTAGICKGRFPYKVPNPKKGTLWATRFARSCQGCHGFEKTAT